MSETQKKTKIKKKPKKLINIIFSRKTTIIILMALQLLFLLVAFFQLSEKYTYLQIAFTVISVLIAFNIIFTNTTHRQGKTAMAYNVTTIRLIGVQVVCKHCGI